MAAHNLFVQSLEVGSSKGWPQATHLVDDTSQGPDITLRTVGRIAPDLRAGVVRGACLRLCHLVLQDFGDIEVAQFGSATRKEDVG